MVVGDGGLCGGRVVEGDGGKGGEREGELGDMNAG